MIIRKLSVADKRNHRLQNDIFEIFFPDSNFLNGLLFRENT